MHELVWDSARDLHGHSLPVVPGLRSSGTGRSNEQTATNLGLGLAKDFRQFSCAIAATSRSSGCQPICCGGPRAPGFTPRYLSGYPPRCSPVYDLKVLRAKTLPFRWPEPESKVLGHELEISFSFDGRSRLLQLAPRLRALVEDGHSECLSC